MNIADVAFKDLKRVFRSPFALIMMFGAPLLLAGLFYFAFGGLSSGDGSFKLAKTRVVIANLDKASFLTSSFKAGDKLVEFLQSEDVAKLLEIEMAPDEARARSAVNEQEADMALIIPINFTQAAMAPDQKAAIILYQDPTLTIGPGIVKDLVNHFMDGFSGAKIAANVTDDPVQAEWAAKQYASYLESASHAQALRITSPAGESGQEKSPITMMGPIMAGMLVFFVFFMGANGAESIVREQEEGTLARLFTTPVSALNILAGKFLGVFITLIIQTIVLLAASALIFKISWGRPLPLGMATVGLIVSATGFGIMLMSFIKSTRQTGPILGGVLTLTGMLGGLFSNAIPNLPEVMNKVALTMPQGWAMQALLLSLAGSAIGTILLSVVVLMILGALFFAIGLTVFRRRFV